MRLQKSVMGRDAWLKTCPTRKHPVFWKQPPQQNQVVSHKNKCLKHAGKLKCKCPRKLEGRPTRSWKMSMVSGGNFGFTMTIYTRTKPRFQPHYTTLHYTTLHYNYSYTCNCNCDHNGTCNCNCNCHHNYTTLGFKYTTLLCTRLDYIALQL